MRGQTVEGGKEEREGVKEKVKRERQLEGERAR